MYTAIWFCDDLWSCMKTNLWILSVLEIMLFLFHQINFPSIHFHCKQRKILFQICKISKHCNEWQKCKNSISNVLRWFMIFTLHVFFILELWRGHRKHTTSWIKTICQIFRDIYISEILFITCFTTSFVKPKYFSVNIIMMSRTTHSLQDLTLLNWIILFLLRSTSIIRLKLIWNK